MTQQYSQPPEMSIDLSKTYSAAIRTSHGVITVDLLTSDAPATVNNFVFLAKEGFYTNGKFHRVIKDFMVQGGDYQNQDGTGGHTGKWYGYCNGAELDGEGNRYSAESCPQSSWTLGDEADNGLLHIPGSLAMAKTSAANTGSSQFYIVPGDSTPSHLDGVHTVFGQVISGLDHITAISEVDTPNSTQQGSGDTPINEVRLIHVTVND